MAGVDISKDGVWDDSALLDSWDEALAEYKAGKYHSLATKGEKVKVADPEKFSTETATSNVFGHQPHLTENAAENKQPDSDPSPFDTHNANSKQVEDSPLPNDISPRANGTAVPSSLLNSVQDEGLKNLMMSWYYAGYYTGLYEGQQKAYANLQRNG